MQNAVACWKCGKWFRLIVSCQKHEPVSKWDAAHVSAWCTSICKHLTPWSMISLKTPGHPLFWLTTLNRMMWVHAALYDLPCHIPVNHFKVNCSDLHTGLSAYPWVWKFQKLTCNMDIYIFSLSKACSNKHSGLKMSKSLLSLAKLL